MRCLRYLPLPLSLFSLLLPVIASAEPWVEDKAFFTESAQAGSSMVDAADLDGDGWIDLVFANGGGYNKGNIDSDQKQQAFHNDGGAMMVPIDSPDIFGGVSYNGRAVKIRDIDNDGDNDIFLGVTWQGQSQLFVNNGGGSFSNETGTNLPAIDASVGDLEFADVDDDGDLDVMLADWGSDSPVDDINSTGGVTQLWLQAGEPGYGQMGTAMFANATLQMPNVGIRWSWDLEFVDLDNDYDLDAVVSCFACTKASLYLFANDGKGTFTQVPMTNAPQGAGALSVEVMNLDNDGDDKTVEFMDLVTTHDAVGGRNRVLLADGQGAFTDWSGQLWPMLENPASYDTMAAFLDYNSDGRPDIILGALQPGLNKYPDRLMENQNGKFTANNFAFAETKASGGTYAIVLADFNLDRRLDVAMAQNENAQEKKVFIGSEVELQPDTDAPLFVNYQKLPGDIEFGQDYTLRLRCHDNKSPLMQHDFQRPADGKLDGRPYVESWNSTPADPETTPPDNTSAPGQWYGEYLWRVGVSVPLAADPFVYRICAIDAAGNKRCTEPESVDNPAPDTTDTNTDPSTTTGLSATDTDSDSDTMDSMSGTVGMTTVSTTQTSDVPTTGGLDPTNVASESDTDSATTLDSGSLLDDDGCGCDTTQSPTRGVLSSLALLGLLGLSGVPGMRRRRARA